MSKPAAFWDRHAERYAKSPISDTDSYEHKLQVSRTYFSPETSAIEIGCGTGSTALLHAPHVKHILATDISSGMLDIAEAKRLAEGVDNITFQKIAVAELEVNEPVDAVMALSLLHLLVDKEKVIRQVHQWLKPGGVFITSTACLGDTMKFIKLIAPIAKFLRLMPLLKVFTIAELKKSLTDNGFEIDYEWKSEKGISVFIVAKKY